MPDAERLLDDPRALRALAHPVRQQILRRLSLEGPATSAMIARELGIDRGAASFHLRQLGAFGMIVVDEERSSGRRRYWRGVPQGVRFPTSGRGADEGALVVARLWEHALDELQRFLERGDPWLDASGISHATLRLTEDELRQFAAEYHELVRRFGRPAEEAPADARPVIALHAAFVTEPAR